MSAMQDYADKSFLRTEHCRNVTPFRSESTVEKVAAIGGLAFGLFGVVMMLVWSSPVLN